MKHFGLIRKIMLTCGLLLWLSGAASGADDGAEAHLRNVGRGVINILTCYWEVPRCLIYRNSQVPVLGVLAGACEGVGLTGVRAFAGVADVLSLGFMTDSIYQVDSNFHAWVWESPWVPKY